MPRFRKPDVRAASGTAWRRTLLLARLVVSGSYMLSSASAAAPVHGLERMARVDLLPAFLENTQVRQVSSRDRGGGNDDGFNGRYSALYTDRNGEHVMFDDIGAGCLYRIWITYAPDAPFQSHRLRFYFDDEPSPRLDMAITNFFDGVGAPLEFPLVGNKAHSSGGHYCYLPFPYRNRLKITLSGAPMYYNMTYHSFGANDGITSWTGTEDTSAVLQQWRNTGADPKSTVDNQTLLTNLTLLASSTGILFRTTGPGCIQGLTLDPTPGSTGILSTVRLQMNWEGGAPEVDVPLGQFFGSGAHEINTSALPLGMRTDGDYYCYFPMPFWSSADIRLVNDGEDTLTDVPCSIQYTTNSSPLSRNGHFHADFKRNSVVDDGNDVIFLDTKGRGHVVGLSLHMESFGAGGGGMSYLEGDERIYIDGSASPRLYGTGNEDYFNAGWYFDHGTFNLPYHGHPWRDHFHAAKTNYTQAYRFHLSDIIPFTSALTFGMEHGWDNNNDPGTFSSVVYYYKRQGATGDRILTADLQPGNSGSESIYAYTASDVSTPVSNIWAFEGDYDYIFESHTGLGNTGGVIAFSVPLVDTHGLILRRLTDRGVPGQRAQVSVDGVPVGIWYDPDRNFSGVGKRWVESEFMIPPNLVSGKVSATVWIEPEGAPATWNAYRYQTYCVKPLETRIDEDGDSLPDEWEQRYSHTLAALAATSDFDADGQTDLAEYIAGTDPTNAASVFHLVPGEDFAFHSERGRLYTLEQCTDLVLTNWTTIRDALPGTGTPLVLPTDNKPQVFRRIHVQKP